VKKYQDRVTGDESDFDVVTKPLRFCGGQRSHEPISKGTTVTTAGARDAVRITILHKFIDRVQRRPLMSKTGAIGGNLISRIRDDLARFRPQIISPVRKFYLGLPYGMPF